MVILNLLIYIVSFIFIWLGAGLIVSSVDRISKKLKLSSFAVSFFILGILTSIPEFAVGLTAIAANDPEIFVGNLLGGVLVIFLLIIPLLATLGNGINLNHKLDKRMLLIAMAVIATPSLLILDRKVNALEGLAMVALYLALFYFVQRKHGILDNGNTEAFTVKIYAFKDILTVLLGIAMIFVASKVIVDKTIYFSQILKLSLSYISLIVLSLGTNLPELSIAIRSIVSGKKDIAFGDYVGSAAANTLLFGILTLINGREVLTINNFVVTFLFIVFGLGLFYVFSRSKNSISKNEGFALLATYVAFIVFELVK